MCVNQQFQRLTLPAQDSQGRHDPIRLPVNDCLTVSKREAARLLGVSTRTFERLVAARLIRSVRGLPRRYSREAIEQFVHGSSVGHSRTARKARGLTLAVGQ